MFLFLLGLVSLGGAAFVVAELVTLPARERQRFLQRTAEYGRAETRVRRIQDEGVKKRLLEPLVERTARLVLKVNPKTTIEGVSYKLVSAGLSRSISPTSFLASKVGVAVITTVFAIAIGQSITPFIGVLMILAAPVCGFILPEFIVNSRIKSRQERISAQLPDALDLLAVSVEAGLGFDSAVTKLIESLEGPLIDEFSLTLSEIRVGESRPEALRKLAERTQVPELSAFTRALIQADTLGISLGRILRVQAADTRERRQQLAEEKAMKAPIKMLFPTVLFIFPAMFLVILGPALLNLGKYF